MQILTVLGYNSFLGVISIVLIQIPNSSHHLSSSFSPLCSLRKGVGKIGGKERDGGGLGRLSAFFLLATLFLSFSRFPQPPPLPLTPSPPGKLCIFGRLGLVFIWSCFASCLSFCVICTLLLTEETRTCLTLLTSP